MRTASYVGFFSMVAIGLGAFVLADAWWQRVILLLVALGVGWYSLGRSHVCQGVVSAVRSW